jgi:acetate kinase
MNILTINTGSSSVRLAVFKSASGALTPLVFEHFPFDKGVADEPEKLLRAFLQTYNLQTHQPKTQIVAHRVVHGGARFCASCVLNAESERAIRELAPLAPLHNPLALRWIEATRAVLGAGVLQVAVFDTAFYASLPPVAATYALPRALCEKHGIRRFGFHGLAHGAMNRRWRELKPKLENGGRVISLQLGSGCSITATRAGAPLDTSMGFSPLEGLVMATRGGDVDAGVLTFLQREAGFSVRQIEELLNHQSGLLGVSEISSDMRALLPASTPAARLAVELFCYRARKYIGAYLAVLGGADAILFGGGVGENAAPVRERILSGLEWCGLILDKESNDAATGKEARLSAPQSKIEAWVVPVDEAAALAREAIAVWQRIRGQT